jgi:hypothetical protein
MNVSVSLNSTYRFLHPLATHCPSAAIRKIIVCRISKHLFMSPLAFVSHIAAVFQRPKIFLLTAMWLSFGTGRSNTEPERENRHFAPQFAFFASEFVTHIPKYELVDVLMLHALVRP